MQNFLPKLYCFINEYNLAELSRLSNNINLIYRNYCNQNNLKTILKLKDFCKKEKRKLFISNNIKLALNLKLDGIYIPSYNKKINYSCVYNKPKKFNIIGSAHNIREIKIKEKQGCEEIFISSIFKIQKTKKILGIIKFNLLAVKSQKKIIALGGINEKNYKKLKTTNSLGFASISWAKKNGLRKLRPL
ncbi:Thiamine monophosphate synthase/TENI [alpha proteobacterium HIMB5]|nr:Thiamine monophosphate synthase/TENI [alpha proteobacterium HIMB5]